MLLFDNKTRLGVGEIIPVSPGNPRPIFLSLSDSPVKNQQKIQTMYNYHKRRQEQDYTLWDRTLSV